MKRDPHDYSLAARGGHERAAALVPVNFFILAVLFFAVGIAAAPLLVPRVVANYFYGPWQLAIVHTFTLGWITASIMGVMYRYAPALVRRPLPFPRLAVAQLVLFFIGASGMVSHFAIGIWLGIWLAALVMLASVVLFAVNLLPLLWPQLGAGVAETGMFAAIWFLLAAATLGLLLAMDKSYGFMGGSLLTNLGAHAALAAAGWVTVAICAVSYRMLPAFILPAVPLPRAAIYQLYALIVGVVGLAATLLAGVRGATVWAVLIALSLLAYLATMARLMRTRRMALDWTARHALAGFVWLGASAAAAVALAGGGASSLEGSRLAAAFGAAGLLGFFSNFIIGMSYHLFAGFVVRARSAAGWVAVRAESLGTARPRLFVFVAFNAGVLALSAGLMAGAATVGTAGAALAALGGLVYAAVTLRTLSFAYRSAAPGEPGSPALSGTGARSR
ncbi:MAG TPA: hypothetical protein VFB33_08620 [Candidatus Binataceae bacterium]|nr:hypothetical protein [Candidatus Binataceae bacterium]